MNNHIIRCVALALAVLSLAACVDDLEPTQPQDPKSTPMTFVVDYPGQTRATATDFERNDRIGLYVADAKEPLELAGNLVNNEALTFDGNNGKPVARCIGTRGRTTPTPTIRTCRM